MTERVFELVAQKSSLNILYYLEKLIARKVDYYFFNIKLTK